MADQRGLDDFLGGDAESATDVERIRSTYKWIESGAECERCDRSHQRFWIDGGRFVCPSCKEW